jgi:hypothetical protein
MRGLALLASVFPYAVQLMPCLWCHVCVFVCELVCERVCAHVDDSLIVDSTASVTRVFDGLSRGEWSSEANRGEGTGCIDRVGGLQRPRYVEAHGCILPSIYLEEAHTLPALHALANCGDAGLPSLAQSPHERVAWLTFAGQIVAIDHVRARSACPYCRAGQLQDLVTGVLSQSFPCSYLPTPY